MTYKIAREQKKKMKKKNDAGRLFHSHNNLFPVILFFDGLHKYINLRVACLRSSVCVLHFFILHGLNENACGLSYFGEVSDASLFFFCLLMENPHDFFDSMDNGFVIQSRISRLLTAFQFSYTNRVDKEHKVLSPTCLSNGDDYRYFSRMN